jgi:hypothetical protein
VKTADVYAASIGKPLWFRDAQYYIFKELQYTTRWLSQTDFGTILWLHYTPNLKFTGAAGPK